MLLHVCGWVISLSVPGHFQVSFSTHIIHAGLMLSCWRILLIITVLYCCYYCDFGIQFTFSSTTLFLSGWTYVAWICCLQGIDDHCCHR